MTSSTWNTSKSYVEFQSVKRWLGNVAAKHFGERSSTKSNYLYFLAQFCNYAEMNPDELVAERKITDKSDDVFMRNKHEELLINLLNHLRTNKGYSPGSLRLVFTSVSSFYSANYYPLHGIHAPLYEALNVKKPPSKTELKTIIEATKSPMYKALFLLASQTGIAEIDLLGLTRGKIKETLDKKVEPFHLNLTREKTRVHFDTFFCQDSADAIIAYLSQTDGLVNEERLFPKTKMALNLYLAKTVERASLNICISPYCFRKYFSTQLKLGGVNDSLVSYWMGHKLPQTTKSYFIPSLEDQRTKYTEYMKFLKITD